MTSSQAQSDNDIYVTVQQFYGKTIQSTQDLQTAACECAFAETHPLVLQALKNVPEEVTSKYYGCGSAFPTNLEGCTVLDLGSGSGRDCYVIAQLVGRGGKVIGIDMTDEQLDVANRNLPNFISVIGYSNVEFRKGYIEDIKSAGINNESIDVAVSNCVINLSPDKPRVLREVYNSLKFGGEFYFSDVYVDIDLSPEVRANKLLWGECVAGAMNLESFQKLCSETGFAFPRIVSARTFDIHNTELRAIIGTAQFYSVTFRLFKLPSHHTPSGSIPMVAKYVKPMIGYENVFPLDTYTSFHINIPVPISADAAAILTNSWLRDHFEVKDASLSEQVAIEAASKAKASEKLKSVVPKTRCC